MLILDADERVTEPLQRDLEQALEAGPACHGYWIRRRNTFLGREIRHGDWGRDKVIRFFARGRALYEDVLVHEEMQVDGQVGILRGQLLHHSVRSLRQHGVKLDRYADWWAEQGVRRGRRASAPVVLGHVLGRFVGTYLLRGGFLDGGHGLVLALVDTYGVFLKYARLWERQRQEPAPE